MTISRIYQGRYRDRSEQRDRPRNAFADVKGLQALLSHNKVYVAARDKDKAEADLKQLKKNTGKDGIFLKLNLSDLKVVKAAAEEFLR